MAQYKNNRYYAITISPPHRPERVHYLIASDRYVISKALKKSSKYYSIWPETTNDRLHYHGVVRINSLQNWYTYTRPALIRLGFITVKRIKSWSQHMGWLFYSTKEYHEVKGFLTRITPRHKPPSLKKSSEKAKPSILDYFGKL